MQATLSDKPVILSRPRKQCKTAVVAACGLWLAACATPNGTVPEADDPAPGPAAPPAGEPAPSPEPAPAEPEIRREPVDPDVLFHVLAAERMGPAIQSEDALEHYLEAARKSEDPEIAEQATRLALQVPDWSAAAAGARRWLELDPDATTARQVLATAHLQMGDRDAALVSLEGLLDHAGEVADGWRQVAALLSSAPDPDLARSLMESLIDRRRDVDAADARWGQSLLAWRLDDLPRAIELAEAAAGMSAARHHRVWAAQLHVADENLERALHWYRLAREAAPEDVELNLGMAEVLHQLGRTGQALNLLEDLPGGVESLYTRGMYLADLGELREARSVWKRLARLDPDDADRHAFYTAQLAELVEWPGRAVEWYARVGAGELGRRAAFRRASLLAGQGEIEQARELLVGLRAEADPALTEQSWFEEARILQDAGRNQAAMEVLSKALAEQPSSVVLLYARALLAVAMDNIDLAEQDLRRILRENPENAQAMNALGYTLADRTTRFREAERLIRRAMELAPEDPAVLDSMGWVLYRQGDAGAAEPYLRDAFERDDNPEIRAHLVEVLHALGRDGEARELLAEGLAAAPDSEFLLDVKAELDL